LAHHANPATDALVREAMRGIRRALGVAPRHQKKAVTTADIRAAVAPLSTGMAQSRDRLILLLGFAGAMRRSELAGITLGDVEEVPEGLLVRLVRSKTDQEAAGRRVEIVYGTDATTCPVRAYRAWLGVSGITEGPIVGWAKGAGCSVLCQPREWPWWSRRTWLALRRQSAAAFGWVSSPPLLRSQPAREERRGPHRPQLRWYGCCAVVG